MLRTLKELKLAADERLAHDRHYEALKIYRLLLEGEPHDFDVRLQIADILVKLKQTRFAGPIYRSIADHDIRSGHPLRAIVALRLLEVAGGGAASLYSELTGRYAFGSPVMGRGVRPAPSDFSAPIREEIDLDYAIDDHRLFAETAAMASDLSTAAPFPEVVPPIPLLSTLEKEGFDALLAKIQLRRYRAGEGRIRR